MFQVHKAKCETSLGCMSPGNALKEPQLLCNLISHNEAYLSYVLFLKCLLLHLKPAVG